MNKHYVESLTFGDVVVTVLSHGTAQVPTAWVLDLDKIENREQLPGGPDGRETFDHLSFHVWLGGASVLIDVGPDDLTAAWSQRNPSLTGLVSSEGLQVGLASIGVRPENVTHVIITHAHWDHFLGVTEMRDGKHVPRYPNARHLLHRADWEQHPQRAEPHSDVMVRLGTIQQAGLLELIDEDCEVVPSIAMIHAPGESPGHCVVRVSSDGEDFYALGDLVHYGLEIDHPDWTRRAHDWDALQASRQRIFRDVACRNGIAVFSHALFPGWGHILASDRGYTWRPLSL
jgi:glyoxylase-like metal-dependent hydrolase (beta-lactamase superfamily II)